MKKAENLQSDLESENQIVIVDDLVQEGLNLKAVV